MDDGDCTTVVNSFPPKQSSTSMSSQTPTYSASETKLNYRNVRPFRDCVVWHVRLTEDNKLVFTPDEKDQLFQKKQFVISTDDLDPKNQYFIEAQVSFDFYKKKCEALKKAGGTAHYRVEFEKDVFELAVARKLEIPPKK